MLAPGNQYKLARHNFSLLGDSSVIKVRLSKKAITLYWKYNVANFVRRMPNIDVRSQRSKWTSSELPSVKEVTPMSSEDESQTSGELIGGEYFREEETEMLKDRVWERFCSLHRNFKDFS